MRRHAPLALGFALAACSADVATPSAADDSSALASSGYHVRYLAMNIGNVAVGCNAYENKLCTPDVSDQIRAYIAT